MRDAANQMTHDAQATRMPMIVERDDDSVPLMGLTKPRVMKELPAATIVVSRLRKPLLRSDDAKRASY